MARFDPAVAAQLVAVVNALLLSQRQSLPPLVEVTQPSVDLSIVHPSCDEILILVDVKLDSTQTLGGVCVNVLHVLHLLEAFVHLHLFDGVSHGSKRPISEQLLAHHFSADHDVGVTICVLRVRERARAAVRELELQAAEDEEQAHEVLVQ